MSDDEGSSPPSELTQQRHVKDTSTQLFEKHERTHRYNHKIHRLFTLGRFDDCKQQIAEALERCGEGACEYPLLARALIEREEGNVRESLECLKKLVLINANSQRLVYELGRTYLLLGEHDKAIAAFEKGINQDPNDWKCCYWKAFVLRHSPNYGKEAAEKARDCLLGCAKLKNNVDMLQLLTSLCIDKRDYVPAVEALKRALELEPENIEVMSRLGVLYLTLGNEEKSFTLLGKALTYDSTHLDSIVAAASILQNNGDYEVALNKYRITMASCEDNGVLWNNIGICFMGRSKLVAAISCLKHANYLNPLDWKILYNLAIVYYQMMQFASAYHFMSSALNINPKNTYLLMGVALILTRLQDYTNARKCYLKALALGNDYIIKVNFALFEAKHGNAENAKALMDDLPEMPMKLNSTQIEGLSILVQRLAVALKPSGQAEHSEEH